MDEVRLWPGGNVMQENRPSIKLTYARRDKKGQTVTRRGRLGNYNSSEGKLWKEEVRWQKRG